MLMTKVQTVKVSQDGVISCLFVISFILNQWHTFLIIITNIIFKLLILMGFFWVFLRLNQKNYFSQSWFFFLVFFTFKLTIHSLNNSFFAKKMYGLYHKKIIILFSKLFSFYYFLVFLFLNLLFGRMRFLSFKMSIQRKFV